MEQSIQTGFEALCQLLEEALCETDEHRKEEYQDFNDEPATPQKLAEKNAMVYGIALEVWSSGTECYVECAKSRYTPETFYLPAIELLCETPQQSAALELALADWLGAKIKADEERLFAPLVRLYLKGAGGRPKTIVCKGNGYAEYLAWLRDFVRQAKANELEFGHPLADILPYALWGMWSLPEEFPFATVCETVDAITENVVRDSTKTIASWTVGPIYRFFQRACGQIEEQFGLELPPEQQVVLNYAGEYGLRTSEPDDKDRAYHSKRLLLTTADLGNAEAKEILKKYKNRKTPKGI